jgi:hypothetical protein
MLLEFNMMQTIVFIGIKSCCVVVEIVYCGSVDSGPVTRRKKNEHEHHTITARRERIAAHAGAGCSIWRRRTLANRRPQPTQHTRRLHNHG